MEQITLKPYDFWAGEALEARTWGCLNITLAQKWNSVLFRISAEKSFPAWQSIFSTYWIKLEVLLHYFFKLQPPKLYKNVQELFCQARKLFSVESRRMTECHFWTNVMLRQPHVRASRASPAQKSQGLRVDHSKNFSRAIFFVFWGTHLVNRCLSYFPVKQIFRISAVWWCFLSCSTFRLISESKCYSKSINWTNCSLHLSTSIMNSLYKFTFCRHACDQNCHFL